jgi:hypothetical protein
MRKRTRDKVQPHQGPCGRSSEAPSRTPNNIERMRFGLAILLVAALVLTACGGGGSASKGKAPTSTSAGETGANGPQGKATTKGGTGGGQSRHAQRRSARRREGARARQRERERREQAHRPPISSGRFTGARRVIYHTSRARCRLIPRQILARENRAKSDDPVDVARAYADREYPTAELRRPAYEGCLNGLYASR